MAKAATVADVVDCDRKVFGVSPAASAAEAARLMAEHHIGCLVVTTASGELAGIVTERDISRKLAAAGKDPNTTHVAAIMTRDIMAATPRTPVDQAQDFMAERGVRHLPVMEGDKLVGMVSTTDILSYRAGVAERLVREQSAFLRQLEAEDPALAGMRTQAARGPAKP